MTRQRRVWRLAWTEGNTTHTRDHTSKRAAKAHERALTLRGLRPMRYSIDVED